MRTVYAVTYCQHQRPPNQESERKYYWLLGRRPAGAWLRSLSTGPFAAIAPNEDMSKQKGLFPTTVCPPPTNGAPCPK